ncbi:MAG: Hsp20/alpha crystallin family protein [Gammaproteobacteria bacterium]|nr:Hsp20/alpha crystallin family protein [Gammaproteobacteria bacterium]
MSENNSTQPKHYLLYTLVILLVGIAGFQTWYLMSMKHHMDVLQGIVSSENTGAMNHTAVAQTNSTAAKAPSVSQQIQNGLNAQMQPGQQSRPIPADPPSLFDDDFFNQPFAGSNWNPYEEIERMQRHMDRVFNNAFGRFNNSPDFQHIFKESSSSPQMKVKEDDSKYTVTVNLPGADEKNISVNLDGQQLTVSGKQDISQQKKDAMGNVIFQERHSGSFQRSITLPEPVKENGMVTHVADGVLTITVPKVG